MIKNNMIWKKRTKKEIKEKRRGDEGVRLRA
jgi:hypothetical protein